MSRTISQFCSGELEIWVDGEVHVACITYTSWPNTHTSYDVAQFHWRNQPQKRNLSVQGLLLLHEVCMGGQPRQRGESESTERLLLYAPLI